VFNGQIKLRPFLWPLVEAAPSASSGFDNVAYYALRFLFFLTTDRGLAFLSLELLLLSFTAWIWFRDGCPGVPFRSTGRTSGEGPGRHVVAAGGSVHMRTSSLV